MTKSDIQEIEAALEKQLPASYKALLLDYPIELTVRGHLPAPISEMILINDKKQLLALNKKWSKWTRPTDKIAIGEDGDGGHYFIGADEQVYELDHENAVYFDEELTQFDFEGSLEVVNETLNEYIQFNLSL